MGVSVFSDCAVLLDGDNWSGQHNAVAFDTEAEAVDCTAFGDGTRTRLGGLKDVTFQTEGYFDADTDAIDPALAAALGAGGSVLSLIPDGLTEGSIGYFLRAIQADYQYDGGATGSVAPFSMGGSSSDGEGHVRGTVIENNTGIVANGSGTALQLGAVLATQKLYAVLHVLSAGGAAPTLDVIVESDTAEGFPSPVTRATFTQFGAKGGEWVTPVAGAITDDWWRISWTLGGGSPDFDFAVLLGIK